MIHSLSYDRRVGMTLDDAMSLIQRRRPEADPVPAFREMLRKYAIQHPPRCSDGTDDSVTQNGKSLLVREERQGAIVGPLMPSRPDEVDQSQEKRKRVEMIGPSRGPATSESIFESVILPESSVVGPSMPIIPIGANQPKDKRRKVEMTGPARAPATSDTSSDSTKLLESSM